VTGEAAGVVRLRKKHVPLRRCVVCGEQRPKSRLIRVVRGQEGGIDVDAEPKAPGRGAYICSSGECLGEAADGRALRRSLQRPLTEEGAARLRELARLASEAEQEAGP